MIGLKFASYQDGKSERRKDNSLRWLRWLGTHETRLRYLQNGKA